MLLERLLRLELALALTAAKLIDGHLVSSLITIGLPESGANDLERSVQLRGDRHRNFRLPSPACARDHYGVQTSTTGFSGSLPHLMVWGTGLGTKKPKRLKKGCR